MTQSNEPVMLGGKKVIRVFVEREDHDCINCVLWQPEPRPDCTIGDGDGILAEKILFGTTCMGMRGTSPWTYKDAT